MGLWITLGAAALVVLLVVGAFVAEFVTRDSVNGDLQAKADAIGLTMADSPVDGGYDVTVEGSIYLTQKLGGTFDRITFTGVDQSVGGAPISSTFDLFGVPSDLAGPAERIETSVLLTPEAMLSAMGDEVGESENGIDVVIELGDGTITVTESASDLDIALEYLYELSVDEGSFVLTLTESKLILWGESTSNRPGTTSDVPLCDEVDGVESEALEASVTPDGILLKWAVTGDGATLDNLGPIGGCV